MVDIAHFGNLFGTDCLTLIALTSLVVLAGAAENGDLDDDTCQSLAAALVLYAGTNTLAIVAAVWGESVNHCESFTLLPSGNPWFDVQREMKPCDWLKSPIPWNFRLGPYEISSQSHDCV